MDERWTYRAGSSVTYGDDLERLFPVLGFHILVFGDVESDDIQDGTDQIDVPPLGDEIDRMSRTHDCPGVNVIETLLPGARLVLNL